MQTTSEDNAIEWGKQIKFVKQNLLHGLARRFARPCHPLDDCLPHFCTNRWQPEFIISDMILPDGRIRKKRTSRNEPGQAHELTFCTFRRLPLLNDEHTRQWLIEALDQARKKLDLHLWAYVLMPEHVHILLQPQNPEYDVASILQAIKQPVAQQAMQYLKTHTPEWLEKLETKVEGKRKYHFWQPGGGYDRNIIHAEAGWNSVRYIHANPVRRDLVDLPTDWLWSSARWYEGMDAVRLAMDATPGRF